MADEDEQQSQHAIGDKVSRDLHTEKVRYPDGIWDFDSAGKKYFWDTATYYNAVHPPALSDVVYASDIGRDIRKRSGERFLDCRPSQLLRSREFHAKACNARAMQVRLSTSSSHLLDSSRVFHQNDKWQLFAGRFSEDGQSYVVCSKMGEIQLYGVNGRKMTSQHALSDMDVRVLSFALSSDGKYAALSCACCNRVRWLDFEESIRMKMVVGHTMIIDRDGFEYISSLDFSRDATEIIGACDRSLFAYNRHLGSQTMSLKAPTSAEFSAVTYGTPGMKNSLLYAGDQAGVVSVWDHRNNTNTPVMLFGGHRGPILHISSRGDGTFFISQANDRCIKLWDLRKPSCSDIFDVLSGDVVSALGASPILESERSLMTYRGHTTDDGELRCHFSPMHTTGQSFIYTGSETGSCPIYDVLTGEVVWELIGHISPVPDVSWHPYEVSMLTTVAHDGLGRLWEHKPYIGPDYKAFLNLETKKKEK